MVLVIVTKTSDAYITKEECPRYASPGYIGPRPITWRNECNGSLLIGKRGTRKKTQTVLDDLDALSWWPWSDVRRVLNDFHNLEEFWISNMIYFMVHHFVLYIFLYWTRWCNQNLKMFSPLTLIHFVIFRKRYIGSAVIYLA